MQEFLDKCYLYLKLFKMSNAIDEELKIEMH